MDMYLRSLLLAIAAITASGCKADISGVMSSNEATDAASDISVSFRTIDDQGNLIPKYGTSPKPQLRPKSDLELRIASQYVGLTVEEARSLALRQGRPFRLGDGPMTADHVNGRITARTKDGIVQSISVEE